MTLVKSAFPPNSSVIPDDFDFPVNFDDNPTEAINDFGKYFMIITYTRPYEFTGMALFPLKGYQDPFSLNDLLKHETMDFASKKEDILWRGSATGPPFGFPMRDRVSRLIFIENVFGKYPDIDVGFSGIVQTDKLDAGLLNRTRALYKPHIGLDVLIQYKYVLCMEGNDAASNFAWALGSISCPFHTYPFSSETVLFAGIRPWVHFVPIAHNGSDLREKLDWCYANESACSRIAQNGHDYLLPYRDDELHKQVIRTMVNIIVTGTESSRSSL